MHLDTVIKKVKTYMLRFSECQHLFFCIFLLQNKVHESRWSDVAIAGRVGALKAMYTFDMETNHSFTYLSLFLR